MRRAAGGVLVLLAVAACGAEPGDRLEPAAEVRVEDSSLPAPSPPPGGVRAERPPLPEELGPDGDLLPGTPKHEEREAARAEYEALKARQTAAARALAPEVDAFARNDPRVADLLAGATYDPAAAEPVGQPAVGAVLTYTLPVPRDFRYVYADFDGTSSEEDPVAVAAYEGARQVRVHVDLQRRAIQGLRFEEAAEVTTYDANGNVLLSSRDGGARD